MSIAKAKGEFAILAIRPVVTDIGIVVAVFVVVDIGFVVIGTECVGGAVESDEVVLAETVTQITMEAGADVVSIVVELMGIVDAKHAKSVVSMGSVGVDIEVFVILKVVGETALQEIIAGVVAEIPMSHELDVGHAVNGIVDTSEDITIVAAVVALRTVALCGGSVIAFVVAVFAVGSTAPPFAVGEVIAAAGVDINGEFLIGPSVRNPWGDEGLGGTIESKANEVVAFDIGRSDDVDDGLGASGVFCGRVGDGFNPVQSIGR